MIQIRKSFQKPATDWIRMLNLHWAYYARRVEDVSRSWSNAGELPAALKLLKVWDTLSALCVAWNLPPTSREHAEALDAFIDAIRFEHERKDGGAWEQVFYRSPYNKPVYPFATGSYTMPRDDLSDFLRSHWLPFATRHAHLEHETRQLVGLPLTWEMRQVQLGWYFADGVFNALAPMRQQLLAGATPDTQAYRVALTMPPGTRAKSYDKAPDAYKLDFDMLPTGRLFTMD